MLLQCCKPSGSVVLACHMWHVPKQMEYRRKAVCSNLGNCEGLRLSLSCVEGVKTMGLGDSDMMHECELQTEETEAQ